MRVITWALVVRVREGYKELLIGTRNKVGDNLRKSELVIPAGGVEEGIDCAHGDLLSEAGFIKGAVRETLEEAGVDVEYRSLIFATPDTSFEDDVIMVSNDGDKFVIYYKDSGKQYVGLIVVCEPVDVDQEPDMHLESDLLDPRFVSVDTVFKDIEKFTPACRQLLLFAKIQQKI